jgi:hypothetical protein
MCSILFAFVFICKYVCVCMCMYVCVCMCVCVCVCVCACMSNLFEQCCGFRNNLTTSLEHWKIARISREKVTIIESKGQN